MDSAGECCLYLLLDLRETEGEAGDSEASPGSPRAQVSCNRMGCWRHVFQRIGVTQRCLGENSATSFLVPLGSPAWRSVLQGPGACHGSVGTGLPSPLQRSSSSFSTCGRLQWVSASEMAYFSTVFKTEATVTAQAREAQRGRQGPTLLYLVLHSQSDMRMPTCMVGEWPGAPAQVSRSGAGRALVPALGACREGSAVGAEAGPPGSRAAGRRVVWVWGMDGCGTT